MAEQYQVPEDIPPNPTSEHVNPNQQSEGPLPIENVLKRLIKKDQDIKNLQMNLEVERRENRARVDKLQDELAKSKETQIKIATNAAHVQEQLRVLQEKWNQQEDKHHRELKIARDRHHQAVQDYKKNMDESRKTISHLKTQQDAKIAEMQTIHSAEMAVKDATQEYKVNELEKKHNLLKNELNGKNVTIKLHEEHERIRMEQTLQRDIAVRDMVQKLLIEANTLKTMTMTGANDPIRTHANVVADLAMMIWQNGPEVTGTSTGQNADPGHSSIPVDDHKRAAEEMSEALSNVDITENRAATSRSPPAHRRPKKKARRNYHRQV